MRIDFDQLQAKNIADPQVSAAATKNGSAKDASGPSGLTAGGIMFGHSEDNILYHDRTKKRSVVDQAAQADAVGVDTQMDQMLIVAQTMSPQDAGKLAEEGYNMSEMDPEDAVNSLDRIKVRLAQAGVNVAGYTDTVSSVKVEQITGSAVASGDLATEDTVTETAKKEDAFVKDRPAVNEEKYLTSGISDDEISETLEAYDLPASKENIDSVREALNVASQLKSLTENARLFLAGGDMEPTIRNVFTAEYSSGKAQTGGNSRYIADDTGYVGRSGNLGSEAITEESGLSGIDEAFARQIRDTIGQAGYEVSPELENHAVKMINAGVPLTVQSIQRYEDAGNIDIRPTRKEVMEAIASGGRGVDAYLISDYKKIRAERVTKEAAISMAAEANLKNIDKELNLDTDYLEKDVETLKTREKEVFDLLEETMSARSEILRSPAALVADNEVIRAFAAAGRSDMVPTGTPQELNLGKLHDKAVSLTRDHERMNRTYEAVGTEVRKDLGDSIRKAFEGTDFDAVLKGFGIEDNPQNERAVRIAAYSNTELTAENIASISAADDRLNAVLEKLTPPRVLRMIRENINPLEIPVDELESNLTRYEDEEDRPVEDFAKYLVEERNKGNITDAEATSYIGIYRFMNLIDSGDHSAVGAVVASGREMNFSTLLSAARTGKKAHIDRYIDNNFNGLDIPVTQGSPRIDQMIRAAFSSEDTSREQYQDEAGKFAEAAKAEEELYRALEEAGIPKSAANITAYEQLVAEGGNRFVRELRAGASSRAEEKIRKAEKKVQDALGDGDAEKIKECYDEMVKAELIGALEGETIDIRALRSTDKVLHIKQELAKKDEYHMPVEFNGELININLKIKHGGNQNSVDIYFETEEFGSVHAELRVTDGIRGAVKSERTAGDDYMRERLESITKAVSDTSGKETYLKIGNMDVPDDNEAMDGGQGNEAMLYRTAKAALNAMLAQEA
ncbi:MAG: DUF6240 domain-containing protein [Lachnospiraceae bacterium]|nr:DUF6240 domain-containing protein [Lachnospiraceae bacterium]